MRLFPNAGFAVGTYTSPMQLCLAYETSGVWAHESRRTGQGISVAPSRRRAALVQESRLGRF